MGDHLVYILGVGLATVGAGDAAGFGRRRKDTEPLRRHRWLT